MRRRARPLVSVALAIALAQLTLAGACEEGVTPDCSDAAARCAPTLALDAAGVDASSDSDSEASRDSATEGSADAEGE